jgi:hypothetical protein
MAVNPPAAANQVEREGRQKIGIDFVDPLFAVAFHIGFNDWFVQQPWFAEWRLPAGLDEWFRVVTFWLGFWTVVLSWVGYHKSILTKPLLGAKLRFSLDVLLVVTYALLLVKSSDFFAVLTLLALIYVMYALWDWGKLLEYPPNEYPDKYPPGQKTRRERVTDVFCLVFVGIWVLNWRWPLDLNGHWPWLRWVWLGTAWFATILYRIAKEKDLVAGTKKMFANVVAGTKKVSAGIKRFLRR